MGIFGAIISATWQWLLGKFGLSDAQRAAMQAQQLGQAQEKNHQLEATLETVKASHEEDIKNAGRSDDDLRLHTAKFNRDNDRRS